LIVSLTSWISIQLNAQLRNCILTLFTLSPDALLFAFPLRLICISASPFTIYAPVNHEGRFSRVTYPLVMRYGENDHVESVTNILPDILPLFDT